MIIRVSITPPGELKASYTGHVKALRVALRVPVLGMSSQCIKSWSNAFTQFRGIVGWLLSESVLSLAYFESC